MKLKLICEIKTGVAFHYYGNENRVYVKMRGNMVLTPNGTFRNVSPTTLVVSHDTKVMEED